MLRVHSTDCQLSITENRMIKQKSPLRTLRCWIMNDGKIGTLNQCLGLSEAVARQLADQSIGLETTIKLINPRLPWRRLPAKCWFLPLLAQSNAKKKRTDERIGATNGDHKLSPPWPDLIISCGRTTAAPTGRNPSPCAWRNRCGGRTRPAPGRAAF